MDLSTSFQLSAVSSQQSNSRSTAKKRIAVGFGDYIIAAIGARVDRSTMATVANLRPINEGVSFEVFRAMRLDPASGRQSPVAVKILKNLPSGQRLSDPEKDEFRASQVDSLVQEVRILCHSPLRDHDNILRILEWGMGLQDELAEERDEAWEKVAPFICVELAELGSLKEYPLISQIPAETKRELCLDVVLGLTALHACNAAHGDIKLENVLVFPHPERLLSAKLSDFSHSFSPSFTSCGTSAYFGTERCEPPEVGSSRNQKRTLHDLMRCDVWALGYLSVEMIANGQIPSDRGVDTLSYGLDLITRAEDMDSSLKDIWKDFIQNCLKNDPEERETVQNLRVLLDITSRSEPLVAAPINDCSTVFGTIPVSRLDP